MDFDDGQVSDSRTELQTIIEGFTGTLRLDFFQVLVGDEFIEDSAEGWRPLCNLSLAAIDLQQQRLQRATGGCFGLVFDRAESDLSHR